MTALPTRLQLTVATYCSVLLKDIVSVCKEKFTIALLEVLQDELMVIVSPTYIS